MGSIQSSSWARPPASTAAHSTSTSIAAPTARGFTAGEGGPLSVRGLKRPHNPEQTFSSLSPLPPSRRGLAAGPAHPRRFPPTAPSEPPLCLVPAPGLVPAPSLARPLVPERRRPSRRARPPPARRPVSPGPAVRARGFSPPLTPPSPPRSPAPRRAGAGRPLRAHRPGGAGRTARRRSPQGRLRARTAQRLECGERRESRASRRAKPRRSCSKAAGSRQLCPGTCGS